MIGHGGDDLEDDYVPDELVASSGDEEDSQRGSSHGDLSLDDDAPKPSGSTAHVGNDRSDKRKRSGKDKQRRPKVNVSFKSLDMSETKYSGAEAQVKRDTDRTLLANCITITFRTR